MRIAVHTDAPYHAVGGEIQGEHAFTLFLVSVSVQVERLVLLGRVDPAADRARYPLGDRIQFVALPFYESLAHLGQFLAAVWLSLRRFWRALDDVDCVWLLGPNPLQLGFAFVAVLRRRRIVLGVRQDFPSYVASRHPGKRWLRIAALLCEGVWRRLAERREVVVVGPELAHRYRRSRRLLEIAASLVSKDDIVDPDRALERSVGQPLTILSVGRLESEKNPLILADVLAELRDGDGSCRLVVCGEGPLGPALEARVAELDLADEVELRGYVPHGPALRSLYRGADVFLHASWTEGLPQVLLEAFAAGIPVVATDVGGVAEAVGGSVRLVAAGDPSAAAEAIGVIGSDPDCRRRLVENGHRYVRDRTMEAEAARVVGFLASAPGR